MKTNVEILKEINSTKLSNIRRRLGAVDENDTSVDDEINAMSNSDLVATDIAWRLGDEYWWQDAKAFFDDLEKASAEK